MILLVDKLLRLHPKYRTWWNYNLASKVGTPIEDINAAKNGWGKAATDITLTDIQKKNFRWVADTSEIPEEWGACLYRQYTFDSYKRMTATVTRTKYLKDFEAACDYIPFPPCTIAKPNITIPYCNMDAQCWMFDDVDVRPDGDLWTAVSNLSYNPDKWTVEIYN